MRRHARSLLSLLFSTGLGLGCHDTRATTPSISAAQATSAPAAAQPAGTHFTVVKTDDEWRKQLTAEQYDILRQKGTEPPFRNAFWNDHHHALYRCAACGLELFKSEDKFESGTGWPSFTRPFAPTSLASVDDNSAGMDRTEVVCARCGGHLGHVFDDGPAPTGKRYCIDSAALKQDLLP